MLKNISINTILEFNWNIQLIIYHIKGTIGQNFNINNLEIWEKNVEKTGHSVWETKPDLYPNPNKGTYFLPCICSTGN